MGTFLYSLASGLILGFTGFILGYIGPLIATPNANQGPLLGIFITGPAGLIIGTILGFIVGGIKKRYASRETAPFLGLVPKIWKRVLWSCSILSFTIIVIGLICIPWHESKYSTIIESPSDLHKRYKTLTSLHARSLSDNEMSRLQAFTNLNYLDFDSGWGVEEAKLTDNGLKNISELNLPHLEWLMLGHCDKITDEGMKYIARIKTLKYLSLSACTHITDAGLDNLTSSNSIETVDLRGCSGISDKGLAYLKKMSKLKEVSLGGCVNISAAGIEELRRTLPNSKIEKDDREWAMHAK